MNGLPRARLAFERPEVAAALRQAFSGAGIGFEAETDLGRYPLDTSGCQMLVLEQSRNLDAVVPRVYSLAGANPELLIVVCVPHPRTRLDKDLLAAGAFDVVDDGPNLVCDLAHTLASARRLATIQAERQQLSATLAHQDKIAAMGVLAAGVSHEINNPCAAILANASALREQLESVLARPRFQRLGALEEFMSDGLEALSDCIGAANRIHAIVKTLNVFSRRSDGEISIAIDVNEQVSTVMRLIGKEVKYHAVFELSLAPGLPPIAGPPNSVTQIVTNLVLNGLQAMEAKPQHERQLTVSTAFDDDHVMLEVGDNGPGMSGDVLARIFDPFFTTKPAGKGTGLGLSITRQLVQQLGGDIFVDSAPGQGARFSVFFERPRAAVASPTAAEQAPPVSDRRRVLVVDDDNLLGRAMERSLRSAFEIVVASSGREALDLLAADPQFDAVLTDVIMPEMDGLELYRQLGVAHPDLARRVVFLTGGITSEDLRADLAATGRPCLGKPAELADVVRTIRDTLRGEPVSGPAPPALVLVR